MTIRSRPLKHLAIIAALAGVLVLAACTKGTPLSKGPYRVVGAGDYRLLVASSTPQIEQGLMYVREIPRNRGMVFIEPPKTPATFWMKNCLVGMDMVFIGPDGAIQGIQPAAPPSDKDLTVYTVQGPCTIKEALGRMKKLPETAFVVEVTSGDGKRFADAWRPSMMEELVRPTYLETNNSF